MMFSRELSLPGPWFRYMAPTYSVGPVGVTEPTTIAAHPTFLSEPSVNLIERTSALRGAAMQCRAASTATRRCHVVRRPGQSDPLSGCGGGRAGLLIAPLVAYDRAGFRPGEGAGYYGLMIAAQKDDA
jgi:5-formyltetrahydrofolate cyclo-ligase